MNLEYVWRRLTALALAVSDMKQTREAARMLLATDDSPETEEFPFEARRALETGMIVSYMRAFTDSKAGLNLSEPNDLTDIEEWTHNYWRDQRHKAHAHTDATHFRRSLLRESDLQELANGSGFVPESWIPPDPQTLLWTIDLTTKLIDRYAGELAAAAKHLLDAPEDDRARAYDAFIERMRTLEGADD